VRKSDGMVTSEVEAQEAEIAVDCMQSHRRDVRTSNAARSRRNGCGMIE
jgi:hypothetical protein